MYILKNRKLLILILLLLGVLVSLVILSFRSGESPLPGVIQREPVYPEASTQSFDFTNKQSGSLTVNSNPDEARVMIDPPMEEVSETEIPVNTTPFRISRIPVGTHTLTIFKEGFALSTQQFEIKANQTTRLNIDLQPIDGNLGDKLWITKLPIESKFYFVEYNSQRDTIIATLNLTLENQIDRNQEIELLKDEVIEKLKIRGADLTKVNIEWVIK